MVSIHSALPQLNGTSTLSAAFEMEAENQQIAVIWYALAIGRNNTVRVLNCFLY